jgi:hypothetical protein
MTNDQELMMDKAYESLNASKHRLFRNSRGAPPILCLTVQRGDSLRDRGIAVETDASNS